MHKAGERLFLDYAGQTVELVDARTGEITRAQIFVAVLGASNYTYACATRTQQAEDWAFSSQRTWMRPPAVSTARDSTPRATCVRALIFASPIG